MKTKAENVTPPRLRNALRSLQLIVVTASSVAKQIDAQLLDRWVRLRAEGGVVHFCFGIDNTITVNSALTGDQSSATALGWVLADGEVADFELSGDDRWIAVQGTGTALRVLGSGPRRTTGNSLEGA